MGLIPECLQHRLCMGKKVQKDDELANVIFGNQMPANICWKNFLLVTDF